MNIVVDVEDLKLLLAEFHGEPYDRDRLFVFVRRTEERIEQQERARAAYDEAPTCRNCGRPIIADDKGILRHQVKKGEVWCDGHSSLRAERWDIYD